MPSAIQLIRASDLSDVAEYAYAATAPKESRLIFLAGSCPLDEDGMTVAIGDYTGQAAACIDTMKRALAAAGATIQDVISRERWSRPLRKKTSSRHGKWI